MSSYGLIMMVLGVCVSGNTAAAVHNGDAGSSRWFESHLKQIFLFNNF